MVESQNGCWVKEAKKKKNSTCFMGSFRWSFWAKLSSGVRNQKSGCLWSQDGLIGKGRCGGRDVLLLFGMVVTMGDYICQNANEYALYFMKIILQERKRHESKLYCLSSTYFPESLGDYKSLMGKLRQGNHLCSVAHWSSFIWRVFLLGIFNSLSPCS